MVTIGDVAQRAGVSIATVSRVLSPGTDPHPVRPATAERVRRAAEQLGYVASPLARGLAAGRSGLIGLVVPDLADPHYPQIASGVEQAAHTAGMSVLVCNTLGDAQRTFEYVRLLHARRVDAIVLSGGTSLDAHALKTLEGTEQPVVLIGRPAGATSLVHVSIDNALAARLATWHLVESGRRLIVHLGGPEQQTTMADRAAGYEQAMHVAGLPAEVLRTSGAPEDGYTVVRRRLEDAHRPRPQAVFAATDRLAIAAMAAAIDLGLGLPADLAMIGFDDIALADQLRPQLSSVAQPAQMMGRLAFELAQRLVAGERVESVTLQGRLVARASSAG